MISLVLADSALERVPADMARHPAVAASAKKAGKKPADMLLDISWHFAAMKGMKDAERRGRPDIMHLDLLEATSIPLYFEGKLDIYIHTINDEVIIVGDNVRLPKSFHRFAGLMEKLFREKKVESDDGTLLRLERMDFASLVKRIRPTSVIGLSPDGMASSYAEAACVLDNGSCLVVGGFQRGQFSRQVADGIDESYSVDDYGLESHIVLARILYEYEQFLLGSS